MLQHITLASHTVAICDICGATGLEVGLCAVYPPWQKSSVNVGDHVGMWWHWGRYIRYSHWTIRRIRYAGPGFNGCVRGKYVRLHSLIVEVAQNMNGEPWKEGDTGCGFTELSYDDFLLWQEGDEYKLRAEGLIAPLTLFERIQKRFGRQPASIKRPR